MKARTWSVALAVWAFAGEAWAQRGRAATLRFRYAAGQRVRYAARTVQHMPGGAGDTDTSSVHEVETVRVAADGSAEQRLRIVRMTMNGGGVPEPVRRRVTEAMTGVTVEFTQDPRGRVTSRRVAGPVPEEVRAVLAGVLESIDQMGAQLPEGPVAPGATWRERRAIALAPGGAGLQMNVDVTYTLRRVAGAGASQTADVGVAMTIATPPGASLRGATFSGAGSASGEATLELGRGRMGRSRTTGAMRVRVTAGGRDIDLETRFEHEMTPDASAAQRPTPAGR